MKKKKNLLLIGLCSFLVISSYFNFFINKQITIYKEPYTASDCTYSEKIENWSPVYIDAMEEFGVPASFMMAIAINESSFGQKGAIALQKNNWHGVKKTIYPTPEICTGDFECYPTVNEGIRDLARLLGSPKASYKIANLIITYRDKNNIGDTLDEQIYEKMYSAIEGVYCTSGCGDYVQKIRNSMTACNLKSYDNQMLTNSEIKSQIDKYYGASAQIIPGFEKTASGWNGSYDYEFTAEIDGQSYDTIYTGDIKQGWLYQRFSESQETEIPEDEIDKEITGAITEIFSRVGVTSLESYTNYQRGLEVDDTGFEKRTIVPTRDNIYYFSNINESYVAGYYGECVWYANGRSQEIIDSIGVQFTWTYAGDGGKFFASSDASKFGRSTDYTEPKKGAVVVWSSSTIAGASHNHGHVAVIEGINYDSTGKVVSVDVSEGSQSFSNKFKYSGIDKGNTQIAIGKIKNRWRGYTFLGYIYLDEPIS